LHNLIIDIFRILYYFGGNLIIFIMKKFILFNLLLGTFLAVTGINVTKAQVLYYAPKYTLGLSLNGNFAAEDAHGAVVGSPFSIYDYQMIWGRGITVYGKLGLGGRQNSRLTLSASYNKMVNSNASGKIPFFVMTPSGGAVFTDYNIWTVGLGYEFVFYPNLRNRSFVGLAVTGNLIGTPAGSYISTVNNALRVGLMASVGYEFVINSKRDLGFTFGLRGNILNLINTENGAGTLNDGAGIEGPGYWRRMSIISFDIGFNFFGGVKTYKPTVTK